MKINVPPTSNLQICAVMMGWAVQHDWREHVEIAPDFLRLWERYYNVLFSTAPTEQRKHLQLLSVGIANY
ncbi:hypothetical protein [Burkholderia sp. PR2]|uniref:hypothetical protein n=1 Tax=Burkholderia sp. PR2 TaxID=3448078 RepID=UPI00402AF14C